MLITVIQVMYVKGQILMPRYLLIAIFSLVTSMMFTSTAQAARENDIFKRFKKPMPEIKLMTDAEFEEKTMEVSKVPYGEDVLAFTMRVDKTWEESEGGGMGNVMLSEKLFQDISTYYGKPTISGRSRLEVQALNIEGTLTAEQWYIKYILEGGFTTEGFVTHNDNKVESLMVIMDRDYSFYLRTMVLINGSKVIMVRYYVPVHYIQAQASMQAQVLASFKLENEKPRVLAEMASYRFLDVIEAQFPKTWKLYPKTMRTADRMEASLVSVKEIPGGIGQQPSISTQGKVDMLVLSSAVNQSLVAQVDEFKKYIEGAGMIVGDKIETKNDFTYNESMDFGLTEVYKGIDSSSNLNDYELWYSVMVGGNYYYMMLLLTPSRNEDFGTWADNTQNFKIMVNKLTPMVGAFLERD